MLSLLFPPERLLTYSQWNVTGQGREVSIGFSPKAHCQPALPAIKKAHHPTNRDERQSFRGTTRNSLKSSAAYPVQTHHRPLTQSRVRPYLSFRRQLLGESPVLHASGSHHPALSMVANQYKAAQSQLLHIFVILAHSFLICKYFFGYWNQLDENSCT